MSCCGGCGCGVDCACNGCSCGGYEMHADIETTKSTATIIAGVAPPVKTQSEGSEKSIGAEGGHTCGCGPTCTCDPCTC